eukprot:gnl/MRDRNA2_/MRDRNA2_186898_c0_seq1.p1 gnl/MRDRNA2_/MRDRNA2_186898_c0~~gnl/MRDRNA2_/MRDRNA2_186898_c0_seq1.p1  ORF type:complete len:328 (-),score=53.90 gnl/MRDRNA2_/MRDRNA2_186898_c0_seq1:154-1089(-)
MNRLVCPEVLTPNNGYVKSLGLNFSVLLPGSTVHSCFERNHSAGGMVYITNLLDAQEIASAKASLDLMDRDEFEAENYVRKILVLKEHGLLRLVDRIEGFLGHVDHRFQFRKVDELNSDRIFQYSMRGEREFQNIHHDRYLIPKRFVTTLIYLNDGKRGGQTLFPILHADANVKGIWGLRKWYDKTRHQRESGVGEHAQDVWNLESPLAKDLCNAVQEAADKGEAPPMASITPRAGHAVVFWHWGFPKDAQTDLIPDWRPFHIGCDPLDWIKEALQDFRELPPGFDENGRYDLNVHAKDTIVKEQAGRTEF